MVVIMKKSIELNDYEIAVVHQGLVKLFSSTKKRKNERDSEFAMRRSGITMLQERFKDLYAEGKDYETKA